MGYKCVYCEKLLKHNPENTKHLNSCKGVSRKKPKEIEEEPTIISKSGKIWSPVETNQIISRQKKNFHD